MKTYRYIAYGLGVVSDVALPGLTPGEARPNIAVRIRRFSGTRRPRRVVNAAGEVVLTLARFGELRIRNGREIVAYLDMRSRVELVRPLLTGSALAILLWQRGFLVLHAAAVGRGDAAVAFLGDPGSGKSSIAAALHRVGWSVLSDDFTVLDFKAGRPLAIPGVAELKLYERAASLFGLSGPPEAQLDSSDEKLLCSLRTNASRDPVLLRAAYVLSPNAPAHIERLAPREAFFELMRQSYPSRFGLGGGAEHFQRCSRLLSLVPFYRVKSLESLDALPVLAGALVNHLAGI